MSDLNNKYKFKVEWSSEDQEYVASVDKYPSLSWLDVDPSVALDSLIVMLEEIEEDLDGK